eukprot:TRINITY_DN1366_c0_g1_i1.p1 TRINITY_DN1366_c0_g1~~TRINITY_DN1366_c0_g1_i1.p1  ORF type:complete len:248 (+),score=39.91 TRINITY_DN1366_c0_g1_i1:585-1328(+)
MVQAQTQQNQVQNPTSTKKDSKALSKRQASNVNEFQSITLQDLASTSPLSHDDPFRFLDDDYDDVKENEHSRIFSPMFSQVSFADHSEQTKSLLEQKEVESAAFQTSHRKTRNRKQALPKGVFVWPSETEVYYQRIKAIYENNSKQVSKTKLFKKFNEFPPHSIYLRVCEKFKELPLGKYIQKTSVHAYYKEKIVEVYSKHNPSKLAKVLSKFDSVSGEEIYRFFEDVCEKSRVKFVLLYFKAFQST